MTPLKHTVLVVSDDAELRATAHRELETMDARRQIASVSSVDAARRIIKHAAPAVILLTEAAGMAEGARGVPAQRLDAAVSSLATYAPVVVIGEAEHQTQLSDLVAVGAADYVVRTGGFLTVALGLVERRLRKVQTENPFQIVNPAQPVTVSGQPLEPLRTDLAAAQARPDFGEILRHELNNPLTGILGNAELLLSEIHRSSDGRLPQSAPQRLETIAALAVRLRESVRLLSQEWESRQSPVRAL